MTNQNNEVIGNLFLEMTRMKEKMASMQEEIKGLKEENKQLRYEYELVNQTNAAMMDRVFPEWRESVKKKPTLRLVG
ncbi:hypothetical protein HJA00_001448 [Salmonella enterica]|nr:hypothetical protein [Salmonella enterica]EDC6962633.1 hypothetical protein [Salmonella enterica subsp. enterica serovar Newport]EEJ1966386.1 hypothetical protein [Salmonella enterica subsp. enterica]EAO4370777.1 hypothetical protein [Salmonella enterica]EBA8837913.1 hypothetical protein [Salmonella enterica]